jgi:hypothetical protein
MRLQIKVSQRQLSTDKSMMADIKDEGTSSSLSKAMTGERKKELQSPDRMIVIQENSM